MKTFRKSIILLSLIASGLNALADTYVDGNNTTWYYVVKGGEATIYRGVSQAAVAGSLPSTLTVPSSIRGYPVVEIGEYAFGQLGVSSTGSGTYYKVILPSTIRKIGDHAFWNSHAYPREIPPSVREIGDYAFYGSSSKDIGKFVIPFGVEVIGDYAFSQSTVLETPEFLERFVIPESVVSIGSYAFKRIKSSAIVIGNSAKEIGAYAFADGKMSEVLIGSSVTEIGDYAFSGCNEIVSFDIPDNVESMGEGVLNSCASLRDVKIGAGIHVVPASAFASCQGLRNVVIGASVTNIAAKAFYQCASLGAIDIPDSVLSISSDAFGYCSSLSNVLLNAGLKSVGGFSNCSKIEFIEIPETVEKIDGSAFNYCTSLLSVVIPNSVNEIAGSAFYGCSSLRRIEIPNSVKKIGNGAFYGCSSIQQVDIPDGVEEIGASCFRGCSSLAYASVGAGVVTVGGYAFDASKLSGVSFMGKAPTSVGSSVFYTATPTVYVTDKWDADTQTWQGRPVKQVHLNVSPVDKTTFDTSLTITMSCDCDEATVRYTLDGSKPTCESTAYSSRFRIAEKTRVRAQAFVEQLPVGSPVDVVYGKGIVSTPAFTPAEVTAFTGRKQEVAISVATEGATIHYTTDGSIPTEESAVYGTPLSFTEACVIKAIAVLDGYIDSEVAMLVVERKKTADSALNFAGQKINVTQGAWITDAKVSHDGRMSIRSDNRALQSVSVLETVVSNASAVSFWWKASCEYDDWGEFFYDHAEFWIDEELVAELDDVTEWRKVRKTLEPTKSYRFQWKYVKDDYDEPKVDFEDCVWIDELSLDLPMDDAGGRVATEWLNEYTELLDAAGGNYSTAAKLTAANGQPVWKSYVMGIDPTVDVRSLKAFISIGQDGKPMVIWDPDANEGKGAVGVRKYTVLGKEALQDKEWADVPEGRMQDFHFFKIKVEVPE